MAEFDPLTQFVNSLGIGVLKVNFRGSDGYVTLVFQKLVNKLTSMLEVEDIQKSYATPGMKVVENAEGQKELSEKERWRQIE